MLKTVTPVKTIAKKAVKPAHIAAHPDVRALIKLGSVLRGMTMRRYMDEVVLVLIKQNNREFLARFAEGLAAEPLPLAPPDAE